ncbi:RHS repeat-associated core domain-containing protein, partial [Acinetobacter baumannii]|nr:RHS repeat-associated core domain-containing protein [Acinetobacter baumannii]
KQGKEFDDVWFYHCDHLGTPQEMTDHTGSIIWKAEYKAWGECKAEKAKSNFFEDSEIISNNIRFQGQYFDQETGLHYNRYRYYSPYVGRFVSKDPIGLLGGSNIYAYAPNPVGWIDPLGLAKSKNSKELGKNTTGKCNWPGKQAHHLIPEEFEDHNTLKGIGFKMNSASNGIMLPNKPNIFISSHSGYHSSYNRAVESELDHIGKKYANDANSRKLAVQDLQRNLDSALRRNKFPLYKTICGKATGLKDGDWSRYIKSSRRY